MSAEQKQGAVVKPLEAPITRPLRDDGAPEWQQIIALFERFRLPPPPVPLRDELAIMLAWARYGEALHAASSQERIAQLEALAQRYYELLRECQSEFRARGATGLVETIATTLGMPLPAAALGAQPLAPEADEETYEIGKRDGYSTAVQQIDRLTGGDGEYRYCTDHDPDLHTPDPASMIQRIVDRFATLAPGPEGWKLVPVEPTPEMLDAFIDKATKADGFSYGLQIDSPRDGYRAMLAAAPERIVGAAK